MIKVQVLGKPRQGKSEQALGVALLPGEGDEAEKKGNSHQAASKQEPVST